MDPKALSELLNNQATEMTMMRILLTCLVRQGAVEPRALLADFERCVDEHRALGEVHSGGNSDPVFEQLAALYSAWISVAGKGPPAHG